MATQKQFTVQVSRKGRITEYTDTIEGLISKFSYTLDCGRSYEREKGNKKINTSPKTVKSLVTNLNNASNNSAADGCSDSFYSLKN